MGDAQSTPNSATNRTTRTTQTLSQTTVNTTDSEAFQCMLTNSTQGDDATANDEYYSDSLEFQSASEQFDGVLECNSAAFGPQPSPAGVLPTCGGSLAVPSGARMLSEFGAMANPSEISTAPSLSSSRLSPSTHLDTVNMSFDALSVTNHSQPLSSHMSARTTEKWNVEEKVNHPENDFNELLMRVEGSEQTQMKEPAGFQRLVSPYCLEDPALGANHHGDGRQFGQGVPLFGPDTQQPVAPYFMNQAPTVGRPLSNDRGQLGQLGKQPAQRQPFFGLGFHSNVVGPVGMLNPQPQGAPSPFGKVNPSPVELAARGQENTTVNVKGLLRSTTRETVQLYFENSVRSGGGKIRRLCWDKTIGQCLLSFDRAEVAQNVVSRPEHNLEGKTLKVSLYQPPSVAQATRNREDSRTVRVENFDILTTTEYALKNHFENTGSGGGVVTDVKIGPHWGNVPVAFVTFRNAKDAHNVLTKIHNLNGKVLKVEVNSPLLTLPNLFSLHGLPSNVLAEDLKHFIEFLTKKIVYDVIFGQVQGVALVVFDDAVDLAYLQSALTSRIFMGAILTAKVVPVSRTVEVHQLPSVPSLSEETLTNYFQNTARSGGSGVTQVRLLNQRQSALVTFEDPEVCTTVVSQSQVFHSTLLEVRRHFECVGFCSRFQQSPLTVVPPIPVVEPHYTKIMYLMRCPDLFCDLEDVLATGYAFVQVEGPGKPVSLVCTLTSDVPDASSIKNTWADDVVKLLQDHLSTIRMERLAVTEEAYALMETMLRQVAEEKGIGLTYDKISKQVVLMSDQTVGQCDLDDLKNVMAEAGQELPRQQKQKGVRIPLSAGMLVMLKKHGAGKDILRQFPSLQMVFNTDKGFVELTGDENHVKEMTASLKDIVSFIISQKHGWVSPLMSQLMTSANARKEVEKVCLSHDPDGAVEFEDHGFFVYTFDSDKSTAMLASGVGCLQQRDFKLDSNIPSSISVSDLKNNLEKQSNGLVLITPDNSSITVTGIGPSFYQVCKQLDEITQDTSLEEHDIHLEKPFANIVQNYLRTQHQDDDIVVTSIQLHAAGNVVTVRGSRKGVRATETLLTTMDQQK